MSGWRSPRRLLDRADRARRRLHGLHPSERLGLEQARFETPQDLFPLCVEGLIGVLIACKVEVLYPTQRLIELSLQGIREEALGDDKAADLWVVGEVHSHDCGREVEQLRSAQTDVGPFWQDDHPQHIVRDGHTDVGAKIRADLLRRSAAETLEVRQHTLTAGSAVRAPSTGCGSGILPLVLMIVADLAVAPLARPARGGGIAPESLRNFEGQPDDLIFHIDQPLREPGRRGGKRLSLRWDSRGRWRQ